MLEGQPWQLIDTPGTLSLIPSSEDEQVTRDVIFRERPGVIVQVAEAKNLRRTLLLTIELIELKIPMVLVLNMADEARERGIKIDRAELSRLLGISVVSAVGITGEGVKDIAKNIPPAKVPLFNIGYNPEIEQLIAKAEQLLPENKYLKRTLAIMLVSRDEAALRYVDLKLHGEIRKQILGVAGDAKDAVFKAKNSAGK